MEDDVNNVRSQGIHEWRPEKVDTFVRALGPYECFQTVTDQVLEKFCRFDVPKSHFTPLLPDPLYIMVQGP
jgi:hypothetical protein